MKTDELVLALEASIKEELALWVQEMPTLTNGYDYEVAFSKRVQKTNALLLQTSLSDGNNARDKKKW